MEFNKEFFLTQLRNGVSMDDMGQALADAMNEAQEAYVAEKAVQDQADKEKALTIAKRQLAEEFVDLMKDYADLVDPDLADILDCDDEDLDAMVQAMDEMFNMLVALNQLKAQLEATPKKAKPGCKKPKSDDEVLANFIKSLM